MLFNTFPFILFLPVVVLLYYLIPAKYRWLILLLASYYFYMSWRPEYALLMAGSTIVDYIIGILLARPYSNPFRKLLLSVSLMFNLGLLFLFKYLNFSIDILNHFGANYAHTDWLLPVGISFYTFQTLSYSIDVYQKRVLPEKHLGHFALYVSFWPQLVAGPIERFTHLAPQLKSIHLFKFENISRGGRLILYGLFIKMVIADNLAPLVEQVYEEPQKWDTLSILGGMFFYSLQIYSDFYGYSLVAVGSALLLGVSLMNNFQGPYFSAGVIEFWKRWHISLSTWFRDYLYFPLGGNRVSKLRWILNISVIFIVSGLWHGANYTFIIWGGIYAILYLVESFLFDHPLNERKGLRSFVAVFCTFILVTLAWVFFRSTSIAHALNMFKGVIYSGEESLNVAGFVWVYIVFFGITDFVLRNSRFDDYLEKQKSSVRWSLYFFLIFSIIQFAGIYQTPFIYFQF